MQKRLLILTCVFFALFFISTAIVAQESFRDIGVGDSSVENAELVDEQISYAPPAKIFVSQVRTENPFLTSDTEAWMRLLHYYSVTRLGFVDIPFNYIVDRQGNLYEGADLSGGLVSHVDSDEGTILVGYFSQNSDITLTAQDALSNLIEDYSYKYGIARSEVQAVKLDLPEINEDSRSLFSYEAADDMFAQNFAETIQDLRYFSSRNIVFSGLTSVDHDDAANIGERIEVNVALENRDDFAWYISDGLVLLRTAGNVESDFAINQVWDSFTTPLTLESQIVPVGSRVETSFELSTEFVLPGQYTESFEFVMMSGEIIEGSQFDVEFEVTQGDAEIVEIQRTNTGGLTVYDCPEFTCEMVASARSGERYVVLEEEESWYKIYVDGVEGWVTVRYADKVE